MAEGWFDHERWDVYAVAVEVAQFTRRVRWPSGEAALADQARRASASVVLNIAEGAGRTGKARLNHYRIARGSAAEVCAVLDVVSLPDGPEMQQRCRRIGAMLTRMVQRG
jgi:S23 ribosomal protein.